MKISAILQARTSSSRLPGKVLKPILGHPMLELQIERVRRAKFAKDVIVATSNESADNAIAHLCERLGVECYRGDLNDVLDRFYRAASLHKPDHVIRLTGDCPLADPRLIDSIAEFHMARDYDYSSNCLTPTYPDGLDVEIVKFKALEEAWREAQLPSDREHVLPFVHRSPHRYRLGDYRGEVDLSYLRWTVDEPADYELVSRIYEALYPENPAFGTADVLALLKSNPELSKVNFHHKRNEGFLKSLEKDWGRNPL